MTTPKSQLCRIEKIDPVHIPLRAKASDYAPLLDEVIRDLSLDPLTVDRSYGAVLASRRKNAWTIQVHADQPIAPITGNTWRLVYSLGNRTFRRAGMKLAEHQGR